MKITITIRRLINLDDTVTFGCKLRLCRVFNIYVYFNKVNPQRAMERAIHGFSLWDVIRNEEIRNVKIRTTEVADIDQRITQLKLQ